MPRTRASLPLNDLLNQLSKQLDDDGVFFVIKELEASVGDLDFTRRLRDHCNKILGEEKAS